MYHRHRFPQDIIRHAVWLYFRFCLSYRDVEDIAIRTLRSAADLMGIKFMRTSALVGLAGCVCLEDILEDAAARIARERVAERLAALPVAERQCRFSFPQTLASLGSAAESVVWHTMASKMTV